MLSSQPVKIIEDLFNSQPDLNRWVVIQIERLSSAGIEAPQAIPIRLRSRLTEVASAMEQRR